MKPHKTKMVVLATLTTALYACGGGGGGGASSSTTTPAAVVTTPTTPATSAVGPYNGTINDGTNNLDLTSFISQNNQYASYSGAGYSIYLGKINLKDNNITSALTDYSATSSNTIHLKAASIGSSTLSGALVPTTSISATDTYTAGVSNYHSNPYQIKLKFLTDSAIMGSSFQNLMGNYTAIDSGTGESLKFVITGAGVISGSDNKGCTYSGQATVSNGQSNIYELNNVSVSCANNNYIISNGLGVIANQATNIFLIFGDTNHAEGLILTKN